MLSKGVLAVLGTLCPCDQLLLEMRNWAHNGWAQGHGDLSMRAVQMEKMPMRGVACEQKESACEFADRLQGVMAPKGVHKQIHTHFVAHH